MNPHPNSARFHEILKELGDLHDSKQRDYGKGDDPFANVRAAEEWGVEPWIAAMIRLTDKVRRLQAYVRNGYLANEGVVDSFNDISVYSGIARVLFEEAQQAKKVDKNQLKMFAGKNDARSQHS